MRTCKETAALITKASLQRLSLREWLAMNVHLMVCQLCRRFKHQSLILGRAARRLLEDRYGRLSTPARRRIQGAMQPPDEID